MTPKPCSNFFLEDLGPEPKPVLALDCSVPDKVPVGRPLQVCLTVRNTGDLADPRPALTLRIPEGASVTGTSDGAVVGQGSINWQVTGLAPGKGKQVCAAFTAERIGSLSFSSTATGGVAAPVQMVCSTKVFGIPAMLLEKLDDPDPVPIGMTTTYTVKVTNQGTAEDSNVQVVVAIAPELLPVSSSEGNIEDQTVTLPLLPKLAAKQSVSYKIVARGVLPGDGHTKFILTSDGLKTPLFAEESTTVY